MINNPDFLPVKNIEMPYIEEIDELAKSVFTHGALTNCFYKKWMKTELTDKQLIVFAINYFARVHATTHRLSLALSCIDDWVSRNEILHNLTDELGHGVNDNIHVLVLYRWINSLCIKLRLQKFDSIYKDNNILSETKTFIAITNQLCSSGKLQACGAILAQEWHGYSQLGLLYEGFRNYKHYYENDEFHDVSEYFYIHLGRAEKEHKLQAIRIASRNCHSEHDFQIIQNSFKQYLVLLEEFWCAIYREIESL